jgi:tetratricopeptide (TPR) repeat protein
VHAVAISPDQKLAASGGWDRRWGLWDLATAENLFFSATASDVVSAVAFSPNGQLLVTGSLDKCVGIWDVNLRQHARNIRRHADGIASIAFSDAATIFSGARDGLILRWSLDRPHQYTQFATELAKARQMLQNDPDDAAASILFARWYAFRGLHAWAVNFLERARAAGGDVSSLELARAYWHLGRAEQAQRELQRALEQKEAPVEYVDLCLRAVAAPPQP